MVHMTDPASPAATPDDPAQDATVLIPAPRPTRRRPPKTTGAAPKPPATSTQARRLVALLDEIYDRTCAPDVLFEIWVPTQWALVRWMVGRCQQRWDKTLPVTARITGPLVDGEMVVDLPLAKNYGELVYPSAAWRSASTTSASRSSCRSSPPPSAASRPPSRQPPTAKASTPPKPPSYPASPCEFRDGLSRVPVDSRRGHAGPGYPRRTVQQRDRDQRGGPGHRDRHHGE